MLDAQPTVWLQLNLLADKSQLPFWSELRKILTKDIVEEKQQRLLPRAWMESLGVYKHVYFFTYMHFCFFSNMLCLLVFISGPNWRGICSIVQIILKRSANLQKSRPRSLKLKVLWWRTLRRYRSAIGFPYRVIWRLKQSWVRATK